MIIPPLKFHAAPLPSICVSYSTHLSEFVCYNIIFRYVPMTNFLKFLTFSNGQTLQIIDLREEDFGILFIFNFKLNENFTMDGTRIRDKKVDVIVIIVYKKLHVDTQRITYPIGCPTK